MNDRLHRRLDTWDVDDNEDDFMNNYQQDSLRQLSSSLFSRHRPNDTSLSTLSLHPENYSSSSARFRNSQGSSILGEHNFNNRAETSHHNQVEYSSRDIGRLLRPPENKVLKKLPQNRSSRGEGIVHTSSRQSEQHLDYSNPTWPSKYSHAPWHSDWALSQGRSYSSKISNEPSIMGDTSRSHSSIPVASDTSGYGSGWMRDHGWSKQWSDFEERRNTNPKLILTNYFQDDILSNSDTLCFQHPNTSSKPKARTTKYNQPDQLPSRPERLEYDSDRFQHLQETPVTLKEKKFEQHYNYHYPGYHSNAGDKADLFGSRASVLSSGSYNLTSRIPSRRESLSNDLNISTKTGQVRDSNYSTNLPDVVIHQGYSPPKKQEVKSKKSKDSLKNAHRSKKSQSNVPDVFTFQNEDDFFKQSRHVNDDVDGCLREDFDDKQRQRKRNHVIFLLIVLFIVAVAVVSAVLAATLGNSREHSPDNKPPGFNVVRANMTLKILNRVFQPDMLTFGSDAFQQLAIPYSIELDGLFLKSRLSSVYSRNDVLSFRNGSIYATSSITFADTGLIKSPKDVENVIESADSASGWTTPDALKLGEFVVCRSCAETKIEYITSNEQPEIMIHSLEPTTHKVTDTNTASITTSLPTTHKITDTTWDNITTSLPTTQKWTVTNQGNITSLLPTTVSFSTSLSPLPTSATTIQSELPTSTVRATSSTSAQTTPTTTSKTSSLAVSTTSNVPSAPITSTLVPQTSSLTVTTVTNFPSTPPTSATTSPTEATTTLAREVTTASTPKRTTFSPTELIASSTKTSPTELTTTTNSPTELTTSSTTNSPTELVASSSTTSSPVSTSASSVGPTVIKVSNISTASTVSNITFTCVIINPNDWSVVNLVLTPTPVNDTIVQPPQTIARLESFGVYVVATVSDSYSDRVRVDYNVSQNHIDFRINITKLGCYDDGHIECSLVGRSQSRTSGLGRLEVIEDPSVPKLDMPVEVIADVEMAQPITCHAQVGYPPWSLKMTAQTPGESTAYLVQAEEEKVVNGCRVTMFLRLRPYTPTFASNGTMFRCELQRKGGPAGQEDVRVDMGELLVVGGSVCKGKPDSTKLRHPYNCSFYINCQGHLPKVLSCPSGQCFDTVSQQCGLKSVIVESTNGFLNDGLAGFTCALIHIKDWSEIRIRRKASSTQFTDVLSVDTNMVITWQDLSMSLRAVTNTRFTPLEVVVEVWLYILKCSDEGVYTCSVIGPTQVKDGTTEFKVYAKPESPTLTVPRDMVEGRAETGSITCDANVGRPAAKLTLMRKHSDQTTFQPVLSTDTALEQQSACMPRQKLEYTVSSSQEFNGNIFRCDVITSSDVHGQVNLTSDEIEFYVLEAKICQGVNSRLLAHPKDCRYFVQCVHSETSVLSCGSGLCFNVRTEQCDILTPTASPLIMGGECYPDKDNVFLPHPSVCNRYIHCEMGREIIQLCPDGQLYSKDGSCSTSIHDSICFHRMHA